MRALAEGSDLVRGVRVAKRRGEEGQGDVRLAGSDVAGIAHDADHLEVDRGAVRIRASPSTSSLRLPA